MDRIRWYNIHISILSLTTIIDIDHIDWPASSSLSVAEQQSSLLVLLDQAARLRLNAIYFQVRPEGDALYLSTIEPWSRWLTGKQGMAPSPIWDPLQFAIDACHARNMELHAWLNPYRSKMDRTSVLAANHICARHPEVCMDYGDNQWMDPGAAVVQNNTYAVIEDIINRYEIDGIHFDDYFYPCMFNACRHVAFAVLDNCIIDPVGKVYFPDNNTYAAYRAQGGVLSVPDWRRDNVNQLVSLSRLRLGSSFDDLLVVVVVS